jgi:Domain of unknown function (DUF4132)
MSPSSAWFRWWAAESVRLADHRAKVDAFLGKHTLAKLRWDHPDIVDHFRKEVVPLVDDELAVSLAIVLLEIVASHRKYWRGADPLLDLSRRALRWQPEDVSLLFSLLPGDDSWVLGEAMRVAVGAAERLDPADQIGLTDQFQKGLERLDQDNAAPGERSKLRVRLRGLLRSAGKPRSDVDTSMIYVDGWSRVALVRLAAVTEDVERISELLIHAASATSGPRPTKAWLKRASELLAGISGAPTLVRDLLEAIPTCDPAPTRAFGTTVQLRISPDNADLIRGLLWIALTIGEEWLVPAASEIAVSHRSGDLKVLNACYAVLGRRGDAAAIAALVRLQRKTRDRGELKQIGLALDEAAGAAGLSRSELTEQTISDGGLDADRRRRTDLGDTTAVVALDGRGRVSLAWERAGTTTARVPAHVADAYPSQLAQLKREVAELKTLVAGERDRLEDLLVEDRDWPIEVWRRRYLAHPVTGCLASRLLWRVIDGDVTYTAMPADDRTVTLVDGTRIEPGPDARVRVWHPVHVEPAEVEAWRGHVMERELAQPFKQAYREVYLLTPAEEHTRVYSNRFAAHVLQYQQAYALMKQRRWATNYLGGWDGGYDGEAKRDFETHHLRAVFYHEQVDADGGMVAFCTTDQVRFERIGDRSKEPVPLADVPPVVFSEAMRDVDLFIGVTSIAADPTWADRGTDRHFEYWTRIAFADLSASGETRRDVVSRLLPRLKIRDRARVAGNYLVVDGHKHTYKIHLGSGNILMSPNDQYLCIVPARATVPASVRFVPFEGDHLLGVVLSKALLLADDHRITDPTILRQIGSPAAPPLSAEGVRGPRW